MTFFDLTAMQKLFYWDYCNSHGVRLATYLQFIETVKPEKLTIEAYEAFKSASDGREPGQNGRIIPRVAPSVKKKLNGHYKDISAKYTSPVPLAELMEFCKRHTPFRYWKKAAKDLFEKGYHVKARNFSQGGGYDLWARAPETNINIIFKYKENVHPRNIEKIILQLINLQTCNYSV